MLFEDPYWFIIDDIPEKHGAVTLGREDLVLVAFIEADVIACVFSSPFSYHLGANFAYLH